MPGASTHDLLDTFLAQAKEVLGREPDQLLITPNALTVLTAKGITLPAHRGSVSIQCVTPAEIVPGDGNRVALVVADHQVLRGLRLLRCV